jgi:hypothetical protein
VLDLSDHTLTQIGTWVQVAILLFMVWQHYGPRLWGGGVNSAARTQTQGVLASLWENRTIIVALVGLVIVAWLHLRPETGYEAQKGTLITWLKRAQEERTPPIEFTPSWLGRSAHSGYIDFRSGATSIINASGNLPPTKIETVAEPESSKFANALVNMFVVSGLPIQDDGQGNHVGVPTTHRLAPGITIAAPVPSSAAEAVRVGFERMGLPTRRSTDHSRTGDYLIVEVGPAP